MAEVRCKETSIDSFFLTCGMYRIRMIEVLANDSLSLGLFLGLGADEKAPDHSTLTLFENRLVGNGV